MEIRRNSHYGKSPIAYPLNCALLSRAFGDKIVTYFLCARMGAFIFGGFYAKDKKQSRIYCYSSDDSTINASFCVRRWRCLGKAAQE